MYQVQLYVSISISIGILIFHTYIYDSFALELKWIYIFKAQSLLMLSLIQILFFKLMHYFLNWYQYGWSWLYYWLLFYNWSFSNWYQNSRFVLLRKFKILFYEKNSKFLICIAYMQGELNISSTYRFMLSVLCIEELDNSSLCGTRV